MVEFNFKQFEQMKKIAPAKKHFIQRLDWKGTFWLAQNTPILLGGWQSMHKGDKCFQRGGRISSQEQQLPEFRQKTSA